MSKPVMEKIGIFGGTFNPVHNGHVLLARHYVQALGLQKLLVIPAKTPPHKLAPELAAEQLRLQMCALAFADLPQAQVSDLEICRPGKSYTIDTVYKLRQLYPQAQLYLLVGSDMFLSFTKWKDWQGILQEVTLCTAARNAGELSRLRGYADFLEQYGRTAGLRLSSGGNFFHSNPQPDKRGGGLFAAAAAGGISDDFAEKLIQRIGSQ